MTQFQALSSWVKGWPRAGKIAFLAAIALVLIRIDPRAGWILAGVLVLYAVLTFGSSSTSMGFQKLR